MISCDSQFVAPNIGTTTIQQFNHLMIYRYLSLTKQNKIPLKRLSVGFMYVITLLCCQFDRI